MCDHTDNLDHADAWVQTVYCDCCGMPIGTETDTYPDKDLKITTWSNWIMVAGKSA